MENEVIIIRGHHLPFLQEWSRLQREPEGRKRNESFLVFYYDETYMLNGNILLDKLRSQSEIPVRLVINEVDALCDSCPRKSICIEECANDPRADANDRRDILRYGFQPNQTYSAKEIAEALALSNNKQEETK